MNLIDFILEAMNTDDDNTEKQSAILARVYQSATPDQQKALDEAFIALCGWSLGSAIKTA